MNSQTNFVCMCLRVCLFVCVCGAVTVGLEVMSRGFKVELISNTLPLTLASLD